MGIAADTFISVWRGTAWKLKLWGRGLRQLLSTSNGPVSITESLILQAVRAAGGGGGAAVTPDLSLPAGNIVSDKFESADTSAPGFPDFSWDGQRSTSIVTMDPNLPHCTGVGPYAVYNNGNICKPPSTAPDWTALHGDYSMRFRYELGTNTNAFAEQRWRLENGRTERELWMRYALRVPKNYVHENVPDIFGESWTASDNNKLWAIWQDAYSTQGTGSNLRMEFRPDGNGGSVWDVDVSNGGEGTQSFPFITVPDDRGKWMYICVRVVTESTPAASDGSITVWRKWADGADTWEQTHSVTGQPYKAPDVGVAGWSAGYLMGADNSGYMEETEFLIDDFNLSTGSLL
jgi:hypothetical protein